jgi:hypothetical protein
VTCAAEKGSRLCTNRPKIASIIVVHSNRAATLRPRRRDEPLSFAVWKNPIRAP